MNYKFNYFFNENYIVDLEHNIPVKQKNVYQDIDLDRVSYRKQLKNINGFYNQRKINRNHERILGVEKAQCLYFPISRIDIIIWQNIDKQGEKADIIKGSITLDNLNYSFAGTSLFHHYAHRPEVMGIIYELYENAKYHQILTKTQKTLPLQILAPDADGKTALTISVEKQSPRSFEIMIDMLKGFSDKCLTKMMIDTLSIILNHHQASVIEFMGNCFFVPPQMQIDQFIPWNDSQDEVIFPCHTSIIHKKLLIDVIEKQGQLSSLYHTLNCCRKNNDDEEDAESSYLSSSCAEAPAVQL